MKRLRWNLLWLLLIALLLTGVYAAGFPDVEPGSWYEEAVTEMQETGLLTGCPDGKFHPERPMSAAEVVVLAARCAGLQPVQGQTDHWAAGYMQAALQAGWYDWDELPPTGEKFDEPIARKLAVKIIMGALLPDVKGDYNTESAKIKDFSSLEGRYYEPVLAAYAAGIVIGDQEGNFLPESAMSRAEVCVICQRALEKTGGLSAQPTQPQPSSTPETVQTIQGGVSKNGWLQVKGTQLCNEAGEPVVLRGMSSHGIQWYGQFASVQSIRNTAEWGANLFRVAMYTAEDGYLSHPSDVKQKVITAMDAAIENDMYVILDWHILSDGNPMAHVSEAELFFSEMAERYKDNPAVIYEICNEPNGNVTWEGDIKPYAERIIQAIRASSPRAVILVGSSTWSQDLHLVAQSPLDEDNLMYTLHFYAGTHGEELRNRIDDALAKGLPVFVSEWGTSRADGNGGVFADETAQWLDFLAQRGISWENWSLCDKDESSAALKPGTSPEKVWTEADLSESGLLVFSSFRAP